MYFFYSSQPMREEVKITITTQSVPIIDEGKLVLQASLSGLLITCIVEDDLLGLELMKQNLPIGTHASLGGKFINIGNRIPVGETLNMLVTSVKIYTKVSGSSSETPKTGNKRQLSLSFDREATTEDLGSENDDFDSSEYIGYATEKRRRIQTREPTTGLRWSLDKFSEYPSSVTNYFLSLFGRISLLRGHQLINGDEANILLNAMHTIHCKGNNQKKDAVEFADIARKLTNMLNDCERDEHLPRYPFDDSVCSLPSDIYKLLCE
ncbi:hypothetical protein J3Q64DRAFT_1851085 [Phycomyces blakesleeanus]|uniref:Uncharacterized protein n=2 Tax=Phycomyces blakesleeanus TaxID=4837 RepID=A0A162ZVN4_PHYB8|nr:hypothetical protein PHYBLDRAFT_66722 [Phycomyces blakesleeanus NRRL 1555(-)]OAD69311.1 hypothetical protein PHYBLDRAFT_66722 [Phycomyces blakesleeanus NRRL 1555(-)]|eukprot:XP_018287351.1 hypothetical protein PHYBLDRAFT_66722 [Phycomyces blakesleeanus NRRL 1555(-)]